MALIVGFTNVHLVNSAAMTSRVVIDWMREGRRGSLKIL